MPMYEAGKLHAHVAAFDDADFERLLQSCLHLESACSTTDKLPMSRQRLLSGPLANAYNLFTLHFIAIRSFNT